MSQGPLAAYGAKNPQGFAAPTNVDAQGAQLGAQAHGKYYEAAYAGRLFVGANVTGATLSAALAATYTGLCLNNPAGSGKNLSVQRITGQAIVAPAAILALGLIGGFLAAGITVHTTALTPLSQKLGSGLAPVGLVDAACTLVGTPAWFARLTTTQLSADLFGFVYDADGAIVLEPGAYLAIGANAAGPASGFVGSIEWEELAP